MPHAATATFRRAVRRTGLPKSTLAKSLGWHRNTLGNYLTWQRPTRRACLELAAWLDGFGKQCLADAARLREAGS